MQAGGASQSDVRMRQVPLSAVPEAPPASTSPPPPDQEMLPNDPAADMRGLKEETKMTNDSLQQLGADLAPIREQATSTRRTVALLFLEAIFVPLLMLMPAMFIFLLEDFPQYNLISTKGPNGLNVFQEFIRWALFLASSYAILVGSELLLTMLPGLLLRLGWWLDCKLSRERILLITTIRYVADYLSLAMGLWLIYILARFILFQPSVELLTEKLLESLKPEEQQLARQLWLGEKIESIIAGAFLFILCIALEKYLMAAIQASFHRSSLARRIAWCNAKFEVISVLYRARRSDRATLSTATLSTFAGTARAGEAGGEEGGGQELLLAEDKIIDLSSLQRAKAIARAIFKTLCPADRTYITSSDFRPYFSPGEHDRAFRVFDTNRKGQLDQHDFRTSVIALYDERFRTAQALIENNQVVNKLDIVLLVVFGLLGLLFALVAVNHRGYGWVASCGTFVLGFSFLFQTTFSRIFDALLFVFVEHAFDVSDNVIIDNERLTILNVDFFATVSVRNDGTILYTPNSSLKGKVIYNKQRIRSEADTILALMAPTTSMEALARIRTKLTDHLTETIDEFTGTVTVGIVSFVGDNAQNRARVKIEARYRPKESELSSEIALHERRANFLDRLMAILIELEIDATIEEADK